MREGDPGGKVKLSAGKRLRPTQGRAASFARGSVLVGPVMQPVRLSRIRLALARGPPAGSSSRRPDGDPSA